MTDALPDGWLPTPFGVDEVESAELAARLTRIAAEALPGFIDSDEAHRAMVATITRSMITANTVGRVWHILGTGASGAIVDLSVAEGTASVPDSPFSFSLPQRTVLFPDGRATFSLVAPAVDEPVVVLLRAQRHDGERTLVADLIAAVPVLGLVLDDVIRLVGGMPPACPPASLRM